MADAFAWAALLGVLGACVGSFVAALATRWPEGRSVMAGRSGCDACGVTVRARDLVPLLSAVALRGRCRDCGAAIPPIHWRVELTGAWIGAAAGLVAGGPGAIAGAVFGWLLLALATLDLTQWWLPDRLTAPLAGLGLVLGEGRQADRAIGGAAGFGLLWLVMVGYRRLRGREGLGGGRGAAGARGAGRGGPQAAGGDRLLARLGDAARGAGGGGADRARLGGADAAARAAGRGEHAAAVRGADGGSGFCRVAGDDRGGSVIKLALLLQAAPALPAPIGAQALPARGCAAYLWTRTAEPALVAMASADPARLRLAIDGKGADYPRTAQDGGDAGFGFSRRSEYRLADGTATLEMILAARPDLTQGGAVTGATLTIARAGGDAVVVPLGGLVGCAAAKR